MFAEIDVTSHAARVAYVAAQEVMALLAADEDGEAPLFLPPPDPDLMESHVLAMAYFVGSAEFDSGETLWRQFRPAGTAWENVSPVERLALDVFVLVCRAMTGKLNTLAVMEQQQVPPPNPPMALEDSIFEPEKSMGEMEAYAADAAKAMAAYDRAMAEAAALAAEQAELQNAMDAAVSAAEVMERQEAHFRPLQTAMDAAIAAGRIFVGEPVASVGEPEAADAADAATEALPPVPNKPRPKGKRAAKTAPETGPETSPENG